MNRGEHSFRFGGELRMSMDDSELHHWERPNYEFQTPLGTTGSTRDSGFRRRRDLPGAAGRRSDDGPPALAVGEYRGREFAFFAQDNWKVRSNVTLNLGLRYEVFMSPKKVNRSFGGIMLGAGETRQEQVRTARVGEIPRLYDTDWNNIGPRLGVSWDLDGEARTVVRAGGGLSYNRINNTVWSDERLNPPFFANANATVQDGVPLLYTLGPELSAEPGAQPRARRERRDPRRAHRPSRDRSGRDASRTPTTGSSASSASSRRSSWSKRTTSGRRVGTS